MTRKLEKFVDRLPKPETIMPIRKGYYEVRMEEFYHRVHRDLGLTLMWGYNRQFPGPTFDVDQGEPIQVKWINNLPRRHLLPVDTSIFHDREAPEVRTVVHLHGSETKPDSDGYPEAWYTRNFEKTGPFFEREVYEYPNHQRGATLWYHDHAMGITRLNVYAGLAGMYIIRDRQEKRLNIPKDDYEIPLVITDRSFNDDGSLFYPAQPPNPERDLPNPSIVPFFLGDTILVNGKAWPYLEVEPRKYRFRILNGSNTRGYELYFDSGQPFYQIGTDGGLMQRTVKVEKIVLEPAERVDVIVDFSNLKGEDVILKNDLGQNADPEDETFDIMQFRVNLPLSEKDTTIIPHRLSEFRSLRGNRVDAHRYLKLIGSTDDFGRPLLLLNKRKWADPPTEKTRLGSTEIWSFINTMAFTHPMHIHLIQFEILDRRPFDIDRYNETGEIHFTGPARAPEPYERGYKDTVAATPGEVTRVIAKFGPYTGRYVWHCHILEHEDYDMMRPLIVRDPHKGFHG